MKVPIASPRSELKNQSAPIFCERRLSKAALNSSIQRKRRKAQRARLTFCENVHHVSPQSESGPPLARQYTTRIRDTYLRGAATDGLEGPEAVRWLLKVGVVCGALENPACFVLGFVLRPELAQAAHIRRVQDHLVLPCPHILTVGLAPPSAGVYRRSRDPRQLYAWAWVRVRDGNMATCCMTE